MSSEVPIGEASWLHTEDSDRGQQSVDARVTEAERGCSLIVDDSWLRDGAENVFADGGIMTETFGIEETPVGGEADLPQCGQVAQPSADAEIVAVVDGRLGSEGSTLLVVLLNPGRLVLDVK